MEQPQLINDPAGAQSRLSAGLDNICSAWTELQKFGVHDGECNFGPPCKECGTPSGRCDHHSNAMRLRIEKMEAAISALIVMVPNAN